MLPATHPDGSGDGLAHRPIDGRGSVADARIPGLDGRARPGYVRGREAPASQRAGRVAPVAKTTAMKTTSWTSRWSGHVAAALVLAGLTAALLWPVAGWRPERSLGGDVMAQTYPWRVHVARELLAGRLPHWSPYQGFGFPFLADIETAVFYPGTLLGVMLFGSDVPYPVLARELAAHLVIAGLGLFLVLVRAGAGWAAAVTGAAFFAGSGFMWAHLAHATIIQSAAWIPWALLGACRLVERPTPRAAAATAVALALSLLGGHPQVAYYAGVGVAVLVVIMGWPPRGFSFRDVARSPVPWMLGLAGLLTAGLTAVQVLPTAVLTRHSIRWRPPHDFLVQDSLPWDRLVTLLVPLAYEGTPRWRNVDEFHAHLGILPLVLAGWALVGRRDRWTVLFGTLAAMGLLGALDVPPVAWLLGAGHFRIPARAVLFWNLGLAGLAGLGAAGLLAARGPIRGRERWLVAGLLGALAAALLAAAWLTTAGVPAPLRAVLSPRFPRHWWAFAFLLAGALVVAAGIRWLGSRPLASVVLLLGAAVDILSFPGIVAYSPVPPHGWWPPVPALAALGERGGPYRMAGRLLGRPPTQDANAGLVYRVPLGSVYSSLALRRQGDWTEVLWTEPTPDLLRTAGVRWLVTRRGREPLGLMPSGDPELARAFERRGLVVWEVPDPLPRAYLSGATRLVREPAEARAALRGLDPRREVLVERRQAACGSAPTASPGRGAVRFLVDEPTRVLLDVRTPAPAPLVLSDTHYPGWRVTIDGAPAPIHRANRLFRMVCVPAGQHRVEFRFVQPGFRLGLLATGLSVVLTAGLLCPVPPVLRRDRRSPAIARGDGQAPAADRPA